MKKNDIIICEKSRKQLQALYTELHPYALKKPHDTVTKFKLNVVNSLLGIIDNLIGQENLPIAGFSFFDEDSMPNISDISLVLNQYIQALEIFRSRNIELDNEDENIWIYKTDDAESDEDYLIIQTDPPTSFR